MIGAQDSIRVVVSPYTRTRTTCLEVLKAFDKDQITCITEDPRVREQDFGNFQNPEMMIGFKKNRTRFGSFYYRFPHGESGSDVHDRAHNFLDSLNRRWESRADATTLLIVSHGLFCRLFLMRYFQWSVDYFESLHNFSNGMCVIMEKQPGGSYQLKEPLKCAPRVRHSLSTRETLQVNLIILITRITHVSFIQYILLLHILHRYDHILLLFFLYISIFRSFNYGKTLLITYS